MAVVTSHNSFVLYALHTVAKIKQDVEDCNIISKVCLDPVREVRQYTTLLQRLLNGQSLTKSWIGAPFGRRRDYHWNGVFISLSR